MQVFISFLIKWPLRGEALHPAENKSLVVLKPKLCPVVRQAVVAPKPFPDELVVPGTLARRLEGQVEPVRVLSHSFRLDKQVSLRGRRLLLRRSSYCGDGRRRRGRDLVGSSA